MCTVPSTRKPPPARKYFQSLASCAPISSPLKGSSRTGGARPGTMLQTDTTATVINARYVRNSSDVRCLTYTAGSAQPGLDGVDREHHRGVDQQHRGEDQPG